MKKRLTTLLTSLLIVTTFVACNSNKPRAISNDAYQQVDNTRSFPRANTQNDVICHNCRAVFKIAANTQKLSNGKSHIVCPVCHHEYNKK